MLFSFVLLCVYKKTDNGFVERFFCRGSKKKENTRQKCVTVRCLRKKPLKLLIFYVYFSVSLIVCQMYVHIFHFSFFILTLEKKMSTLNSEHFYVCEVSKLCADIVLSLS